MEPIAWGNAAVPDVFPAQNLLADQCHHDSVVHVVVGRITISNILQREARNEANDVRIGGLEDPIDLAVICLRCWTNAWMAISVGLNIIASHPGCYSGSGISSPVIGLAQSRSLLGAAHPCRR